MIRKYEDHDLEELLEVWYESSLVAHHFMDEGFYSNERKAIIEKYLPNTETWVYEVEGKVIGFISLLEDNVGAIFVHPLMQGKGIGKSLMDHAKALRGQLELDVFKSNEIGRTFYDRYGFEIVKEYIHEETGQVMLRMRLN